MRETKAEAGAEPIAEPASIAAAPRRKESAWVRWAYRAPVLFVLGFFLLHYLDLPHLLRTDRRVDLDALHLATLGGAPLAPSLTRGKVVVLNYWAPWCGPCRAEMPSLQSLMAQSRGHIVVLGVLADPSTAQQARLYMDANNLSYPLVQMSPALTRVFGPVHVLPTTFYLSPLGRVTQAIQGRTPRLLMDWYVRRAARH